MVALWNTAGHYIFALWFLSSFFFSSPNLSGRRLDVYHTSTHGLTLRPSLAFSYIASVTARPNFAAWYKEWNYRTFADSATYIRQGGHHVGHQPTFLVNVATLPCESQITGNVILQRQFAKENCTKCITASSKWTRVIMCFKFT